jgi:molecular chaperone GrpE
MPERTESSDPLPEPPGSSPAPTVPAQEDAEGAARVPEQTAGSAVPSTREVPGPAATGEAPAGGQARPLTDEEEGYLLQLQRLQAEFSNYRKRITRERAEWENRARGDLVAGLIPVLDDLARARDAHASNPPSAEAEGLLLILAHLEEALAVAGLEKQATPAGTLFDPHVHEAILSSPSDEVPEGAIIETLQPGYLLRSQLLRPARVRVSQGPSIAVS